MWEISPEVASFLAAIVDQESARSTRPSGILALDADLLGVLSSESSSVPNRTAAADLLGLAPCAEIRQALLAIASDEKFAPLTRSLAIRALGSVPDQAALDTVTPFLVDIRLFEPAATRLPGFTLPETLAGAARAAVLRIALDAPELNYLAARAVTETVLQSGVLIEPHALQWWSGLRILQNIRILLNRYDFATVFGKKNLPPTQRRYRFNKKPRSWTQSEIANLIRKRGFFDQAENPDGAGVEHTYEAPFIKGDWVVLDHSSGLMWALAVPMADRFVCPAPDLRAHMKQFRHLGYAGFHDWRLPTVDEAMSLLQPPSTDSWCEDPIFLHRSDRIWTSDRINPGGALVVWVAHGFYAPAWTINDGNAFVRAVRRFP